MIVSDFPSQMSQDSSLNFTVSSSQLVGFPSTSDSARVPIVVQPWPATSSASAERKSGSLMEPPPMPWPLLAVKQEPKEAEPAQRNLPNPEAEDRGIVQEFEKFSSWVDNLTKNYCDNKDDQFMQPVSMSEQGGSRDGNFMEPDMRSSSSRPIGQGRNFNDPQKHQDDKFAQPPSLLETDVRMSSQSLSQRSSNRNRNPNDIPNYPELEGDQFMEPASLHEQGRSTEDRLLELGRMREDRLMKSDLHMRGRGPSQRSGGRSRNLDDLPNYPELPDDQFTQPKPLLGRDRGLESNVHVGSPHPSQRNSQSGGRSLDGTNYPDRQNDQIMRPPSLLDQGRSSQDRFMESDVETSGQRLPQRNKSRSRNPDNLPDYSGHQHGQLTQPEPLLEQGRGMEADVHMGGSRNRNRSRQVDDLPDYPEHQDDPYRQPPSLFERGRSREDRFGESADPLDRQSHSQKLPRRSQSRDRSFVQPLLKDEDEYSKRLNDPSFDDGDYYEQTYSQNEQYESVEPFQTDVEYDDGSKFLHETDDYELEDPSVRPNTGRSLLGEYPGAEGDSRHVQRTARKAPLLETPPEPASSATGAVKPLLEVPPPRKVLLGEGPSPRKTLLGDYPGNYPGDYPGHVMPQEEEEEEATIEVWEAPSRPSLLGDYPGDAKPPSKAPSLLGDYNRWK
jgi:hypothetical protein